MLRRSAGFRVISTECDPITASNGSIKAPKVPASSHVLLYDIEHIVDLDACRRAMPQRVADLRGKADELVGGRELVARAAGVDPKTLRTFLDGGRVSAESLIDIIERGLALKFADVVKPAKVA